jgi:radical SAM protein (TIGR01212 family)
LREFLNAVERAKTRALRLCTHLILGFPTESRADILQTPSLLNRLGVDGVKLHNLHVIRHTALERLYRAGGMALLGRDEYVSLVVDFVERLAPEIVIHRLTGATYRELTVAPEWSINKIGLLNEIHRELDRRNSWQGKGRAERSSGHGGRQGADPACDDLTKVTTPHRPTEL